MKRFITMGIVLFMLVLLTNGCAANSPLGNHLKGVAKGFFPKVSNASATLDVSVGGKIGTIWYTKDLKLRIIDRATSKPLQRAKVRVVNFIPSADPEGWVPVDNHGKVHLYLPMAFPEPVTVEVQYDGRVITKTFPIMLYHEETVAF